MNLHEYQGKELLSKYGVKIQRGKVASTPEEAVEAAKKLTLFKRHSTSELHPIVLDIATIPTTALPKRRRSMYLKYLPIHLSAMCTSIAVLPQLHFQY